MVKQILAKGTDGNYCKAIWLLLPVLSFAEWKRAQKVGNREVKRLEQGVPVEAFITTLPSELRGGRDCKSQEG